MAIAGQHRIVIEGPEAVVRLGYQKAATLGAWKVDGESFTARVIDADGFRITQAPLVLEIPNPDGIATKRRLTEVTIAGGHLWARLLPRRTEP